MNKSFKDNRNCCTISNHPIFSVFSFVKFVKLFEIWVFFFDKYGYQLCACINLEIDTCAQNINIPALITTFGTPVKILVAKKN